MGSTEVVAAAAAGLNDLTKVAEAIVDKTKK